MQKTTRLLLIWLGCLASFQAAAAPPDTLLIDFGLTVSPPPWNNVTDPIAGAIADMVTAQGLTSGIGIEINDRFNNNNANGVTAPDPSLQMPSSATGDSFFGNTATFGGQIQATGGFILTGLNPATRYSFEFFASRMGVSDNREAVYTLTGASTHEAFLDASNNTSQLATVSQVRPNAQGEISVVAGPGPNNTNGSGFFYLGALRITYTLTKEDTVQIDFGNVLSPAPWNNITDPAAGAIADMTNASGFTTGIGIAVNDRFNNINTAGATNPDSALQFPGSATGDSFFGNTATFGGQIQATGGVIFTGLDPAKPYSFTIFASRMSSPDNREARYTLTGKTTAEVFLDASNNTSNAAYVTDLLPDSTGAISLVAEPGPNNNNGFGFYYLGAIRLTYPVSITPPPPVETLTLISPTGGEIWESGKGVQIRWQSANVIDLDIELSQDGGQTWNLITTAQGVAGKQGWNVPADTSSNCRIRLTSSQISVQSDSAFAIVPDNGRDLKIIVLGSSTAAGTGPSNPDSAWVKRYFDYLYSRNTDFLLSNLAQGGFTTYNILPTGSPIPSGVNQTVNTQKNITKAIDLFADAIIINMPSNDANLSYPVADQLANYDLILAAAAADSVPVWITTTQPRNFDAAKIQIQQEMRDSTLARFGNRAIDFWTTLAQTDGTIDPAYNSGDGIHLNQAAHKILFERVLGAGVHTYLLNAAAAPTRLEQAWSPLQAVQIYPNPTAGSAYIELMLTDAAEVGLSVIDLQGREVARIPARQAAPGTLTLEWERGGAPAGLYLFRIHASAHGKTTGQAIRVFVTD